MNVSKQTLEMFADLIAAEGKIIKEFYCDEAWGVNKIGVKYFTGRQLVELFNDIGFDDEYEQLFLSGVIPSRRGYVLWKLEELNDEDKFEDIVESYLDPRNFLSIEPTDRVKILSHVSRSLYLDGYGIEQVGEGKTTRMKVKNLDGSMVKTKGLKDIDDEFISEYLEKCKKNLQDKDFPAAIGSAKMLTESVLKKIHIEIFKKPAAEGINFHELYKCVSKELNMHTSSQMDSNLKNIVKGLSSAISGFAEIRNKAGDGHGRSGGRDKSYKVQERHALLVVNSAGTISQFLYQVYQEWEKNKKGDPQAAKEAVQKVSEGSGLVQ